MNDIDQPPKKKKKNCSQPPEGKREPKRTKEFSYDASPQQIRRKVLTKPKNCYKQPEDKKHIFTILRPGNRRKS